jgi:serine/threonine protein kinase
VGLGLGVSDVSGSLKNSHVHPSKFKMDQTLPFIPAKDVIVSGKCIGGGKFGEVYKASWGGKVVAKKRLILQSLTPMMLKDFQNECKMMLQLCHPNILKLFGVCVDDEFAMVLEYATEGNLYELLHSEAEFPWSMRVKYAHDIASGVEHLHSHKILHRDLKSLNVLIFKDTAKLCGKSVCF